MALNLKHALLKCGVTQDELAKRTGIAQSTISFIVTNRSTPKNATLAKIADALGVSMHELYDAPDEQVIYCPHCGGAIKISADKNDNSL